MLKEDAKLIQLFKIKYFNSQFIIHNTFRQLTDWHQREPRTRI